MGNDYSFKLNNPELIRRKQGEFNLYGITEEYGEPNWYKDIVNDFFRKRLDNLAGGSYYKVYGGRGPDGVYHNPGILKKIGNMLSILINPKSDNWEGRPSGDSAEALNITFGKPAKNAQYWEVSPLEPPNSKDEDDYYFRVKGLSREKLVEDMLNYIERKSKKWETKEEQYRTYPTQEELRVSESYQDWPHNSALGNFSFTYGNDEGIGDWLSYYDKNDYGKILTHVMGGKPFEVYDKIYIYSNKRIRPVQPYEIEQEMKAEKADLNSVLNNPQKIAQLERIINFRNYRSSELQTMVAHLLRQADIKIDMNQEKIENYYKYYDYYKKLKNGKQLQFDDHDMENGLKKLNDIIDNKKTNNSLRNKVVKYKQMWLRKYNYLKEQNNLYNYEQKHRQGNYNLYGQ